MEKKYVVEKTNCRSLGSVAIESSEVQLKIDPWGKLKCIFHDGEHLYDIPITDLRLRKVVERDGADGLKAERAKLKRESRQVVLRLGLAFQYAGPAQDWDPERCYLQLNGLIGL